MFECNQCKSRDILVRGWYNPNERYAATDWDSSWCEDCKEEVELDEVEEE
jgi:hypothetical protein|tara:strand:- start:75 stop:224 length:150 start_codon:yes stop_codon:yes gene_type:complete